MPRVKPEERKRAKRPKTRTGCLTCRTRRIKCDEQKPACRRCTSTGRKCDGYQHIEVSVVPTFTDQPVLHWVGPVPSFQEQRAFEFFRHITVEQLPGSCDRDLWSSVLLQAAYDDVGIRHAIVALGTLHEYYINTGEAERVKDDFGMRQYNLAIRQHVEQLTQAHSKHVTSYIVASILFICIELLQTHYESALSLLNKSVRLFYDEALKEAATTPWPLEMIEFIFQRLQVQATSMFGPPAVYRPQISGMKSAGSRIMPKQLRSVQEAKAYFQHYYFSWALADREFTGENWRVYMEMFHDWKAAYDALIALPDVCTSKEDQQTARLLMLYRMLMDNSATEVSQPDFNGRNVMLQDRYIQDRARRVAVAETFLRESSDHAANAREKNHHFTLELEVVGPLYDIALDCRDPLLRRKAIALLRDFPRREGLWDSVLASRTAERLMAVEESAVPEVKSAADIPEWARISRSVGKFNPEGERRVVVDFKREQTSELCGAARSVRQVIEW